MQPYPWVIDVLPTSQSTHVPLISGSDGNQDSSLLTTLPLIGVGLDWKPSCSKRSDLPLLLETNIFFLATPGEENRIDSVAAASENYEKFAPEPCKRICGLARAGLGVERRRSVST